MEARYVVSIFFPMDKIKSVLGKNVVEVIKLTGIRVQEFCKISIEAIGVNQDYVHILFQPNHQISPEHLVRMFKVASAHEMLMRKPSLKKMLLRSEFLSDRYYVAIVGEEEKRVIKRARLRI
jgi:REP element-mobilizing transposase RayT